MRKSEDNGKSFDKQTVFARSIGGDNIIYYGSDFKITDNGIHYVWSGNREIFLARSLDGGNNFEVLEIEEGQGDNDSSQIIKGKIWPSLTVDSNNNTYVIWYETHIEENTIQPLYDLYTAKLKNGQKSFTESRIIAKCDSWKGGIMQPSIVATSNDKVFVFWNKAASNFQDNLYSKPLYTMSSDEVIHSRNH